MEKYLPLIMSGLIFLFFYQREVCRREGRPFFRLSSNDRQSPKSLRVAAPQRSQQKYRQRSDNTPRVQRFKNRPVDGSKESTVVSYYRELQVLQQLAGSGEAADELVNQVQFCHPDKSLAWCTSKALHDLNSAQDSRISVRRDLMERLNVLTHNQEVSQRLVRQLCSKYPERGADWCAERAIADIERDRR